MNDSKRSEWHDKVTDAMYKWSVLFQAPEHVRDNTEVYVNCMTNCLLTEAGSAIRRNWDECCDRVVFKTRFWPTLADLQAVADELTHNAGPNI